MFTAGGVETEMGPASFGEQPMEPRDVARQVMGEAKRKLTHLVGAGSDLFLPAGGRLMIDNGQHVEYATPEAVTPAGMVVAVRAGERLVEQLVRAVPEAVVARTNQCYLTGATYGSHENYCIRQPIDVIHRHLMTHLITRIIMTGAGGLDPRHRGISFLLSARGTHFVQVRSSLSRSLVSHRDEPHADGFKRLHVTCGETLALDRPLYLRLGTTALLVGLIDSGRLDPSRLPRLREPRAAMNTVLKDTSLRERLPTSSGGVSAIQLQRQLLGLAESALERPGDGDVPAWSSDVLAEWRRTLDGLEHAPGDAVLDWVVKAHLFNDQVARSGIEPEELRRANRAIEMLQREPTAWRGNHLVEPDGVNASVRRCLELRERLCRLDFFFSTLPGGLVTEAAKQLDDHVPGVTEDAIRRAMHAPPDGPRAELRARYIRRLNRTRSRYEAGWAYIRDRRENRVLRMPDPFTNDARWQTDVEFTPRRPARSRTPIALLSDAYNCGNYALLKHLLDARCENPEHLPYRAWAEARTGDIAAAERAVETYVAGNPTHEIPGLYAGIYRFRGLTPSLNIWRWIQRGDGMPSHEWSNSGYLSFLGHKGVALRCAGRLDEAIATLRASLEIPVSAPNHQRLVARNRCDLAETLRMKGERDEPLEQLAQARAVFMDNGYEGEYADHYLLAKARLSPEDPGTMRVLQRARRLLHHYGNPIAVVRASLLMARITEDASSLRHARSIVTTMRSRVPDLRTSDTLRGILRRWNRWCGGWATPDDAVDRFWFV